MSSSLPMPALVQRWSDAWLADVPVGEVVTRAARESGSLLRAPATEDQVRAVEENLGRRLPPSYREFLLVSDGAYGDLYGPTLADADGGDEQAPPESSVIGVGFLPCGDLRWLREVSEWEANLYLEWADCPGVAPTVVDGAEVWPWAPMADGLVIATNKAPGTTCLVPVNGAEEWQVWNIHKESSEAYVSFRAFLEYQVARRDPLTTVAEVREMLERAAAGDQSAVHRLSWVTTPDAIPLLVASVESAGPGLTSLGRIGTPEAIDALARVRSDASAAALALAGSSRARDVLAEWGCAVELSLLGDPRAAEIAARQIADGSLVATPGKLDQAEWVLRRSGVEH